LSTFLTPSLIVSERVSSCSTSQFGFCQCLETYELTSITRSLFQAIDHDLSAPEIDSKIDTLQLALEIFSSTPTSPSLGAVVKQGQRILSGLFREEERRRTGRAARALMLASSGGVDELGVGEEEEETETFAEVLQRIARNLNSDSAPHRGTPPPTRNIPSKASAARFTSATFPPSAPSSLPPFDELSVPTSDPPFQNQVPDLSNVQGSLDGGRPVQSGYDYHQDAQTWPFPRPSSAVDPLSLQFFHELDVGLPLPNLDFSLGSGSNMDGTHMVADAASYWGAGSRAAEFAAEGGGVAGGDQATNGGGGMQQQNLEWTGQGQMQGDPTAWSLDNLGLGGW